MQPWNVACKIMIHQYLLTIADAYPIYCDFESDKYCPIKLSQTSLLCKNSESLRIVGGENLMGIRDASFANYGNVIEIIFQTLKFYRNVAIGSILEK